MSQNHVAVVADKLYVTLAMISKIIIHDTCDDASMKTILHKRCRGRSDMGLSKEVIYMGEGDMGFRRCRSQWLGSAAGGRAPRAFRCRLAATISLFRRD